MCDTVRYVCGGMAEAFVCERTVAKKFAFIMMLFTFIIHLAGALLSQTRQCTGICSESIVTVGIRTLI